MRNRRSTRSTPSPGTTKIVSGDGGARAEVFNRKLDYKAGDLVWYGTKLYRASNDVARNGKNPTTRDH